MGTQATQDELRREGRWAVRKGWATAIGDLETIHELRQPETQEADYGVDVVIPSGIPIPKYIFWHLFSGHRRQYDLEWYLLRLGGLQSLRIIVENFDLCYGEKCDLPPSSKTWWGERAAGSAMGCTPAPHALRGRKRASDQAARRRFATGIVPGGASGSPARSAATPTSTRTSCGTPARCTARWPSRGESLHEHPADPGRHPYPSIFATPYFLELERRASASRITFPQCMLGASSRKDTTHSQAPPDSSQA